MSKCCHSTLVCCNCIFCWRSRSQIPFDDDIANVSLAKSSKAFMCQCVRCLFGQFLIICRSNFWLYNVAMETHHFLTSRSSWIMYTRASSRATFNKKIWAPSAFLSLSAPVGSLGENFAHTANEMGYHGDAVTFHLLQIHLRGCQLCLWVKK